MDQTKVNTRLTCIAESNPDDLLNLRLSARTYNALRRGGITTISELADKPEEQWPRIRLLGEKALQELELALLEYQCQKKLSRSLYQCFNARVRGDKIRCIKGYSLSAITGTIGIKDLAMGKPLIFEVCQKCPDYEEMGPGVPPSERGWNHRRNHGQGS